MRGTFCNYCGREKKRINPLKVLGILLLIEGFGVVFEKQIKECIPSFFSAGFCFITPLHFNFVCFDKTVELSLLPNISIRTFLTTVADFHELEFQQHCYKL